MPENEKQRNNGSVAPWLIGSGVLAFAGMRGYKHFSDNHLGKIGENLDDVINKRVASTSQANNTVKPGASTDFWHKFTDTDASMRGIGQINSFNISPIEVEDAHYGSWDNILSPDQANAWDKIVRAQMTDFPSVINNTQGSKLHKIQDINKAINESNRNYFNGISSRAEGRLSKTDIEDIMLPAFGRKGSRFQTFIEREQRSTSRLQDVAERITAKTGFETKIVGIKSNAGDVELGFNIGFGKKSQFVSLGAVQGTSLRFGENIYQGPQVILGKSGGKIKAMTFHETIAEILEQKIGEIQGMKSESGVKRKISSIISEPKQTAIFSDIKDPHSALMKRQGRPLSTAEVYRGNLIKTLPSVVEESGVNQEFTSHGTLRRVVDWANEADWDPRTRSIVFPGSKPGQKIEMHHLLRSFSAGLKGPQMADLTFQTDMVSKALSVSGVMTPLQKITKEGFEEMRTGYLRVPKTSDIFKSGSEVFDINKWYGYDKFMQKISTAGLSAGEGGERYASSISGKVFMLNDVERLNKKTGKWEKVSPGQVSGLGLPTSSGSGSMIASYDLGRFSHESESIYSMVRKGGHPAKSIKDVIRDLSKKGNLTAEQLGREGIEVRKLGKEGMLDFETGRLEFDEKILAETSESGSTLTLPGRRTRSLQEGGFGLKMAAQTQSASRPGFFDSPGTIGALYSSNVKPETQSRFIWGTIQKQLDMSDISQSDEISSYAANLALDFGRADPAKHFKGMTSGVEKWNKLTSLMVEDLTKRGYEKRKIESFKRGMEQYGPGKTLVFSTGGERYRASGATSLVGTVEGRLQPLESETKLYGPVGRYKREYEKQLESFKEILRKKGGEHPGAKHFLEAQADKRKLLTDVMQHDEVPEHIIKSFNEAEMKQMRSIREMSTSLEGHKPVPGINKEYDNLMRLESRYRKKLMSQRSKKPMKYRPQDFMLMSIKAHADPNRDTSVYEYLLNMQTNSQNRKRLQNLSMGAGPLFGSSTKKMIEEADRGVLFGNKAFNLTNAKDVEQLKAVTNVLHEIKTAVDSSSDDVVSQYTINEIIQRGKSDFEKVGLKGVDAEDILYKNLAVTGIPEGTFMDMKIEQALKKGTDSLRVSSPTQREIVLPALGATGRLFTKGASSAMIQMNALRRSILGVAEGLGSMIGDEKNIQSMIDSYSNFLVSMAKEAHKTGMFGKAGELSWVKSGYPNIRAFDASDIADIAKAGSARQAAEEAATVRISKQMAEEWGITSKLKRGENLYAHVQAYPTLAQSEMRTVKVKLDESLLDEQMKVGYGISAGAARDFDADRMAIMYLGDVDEIANNMIQSGMHSNRRVAKEAARRVMKGIGKDFSADAAAIKYLHDSEIRLARRIAETSADEQFKRLGKESRTQVVLDVMNDLNRQAETKGFAELDKDWVRKELRKNNLGEDIADNIVDTLRAKLIPSKELGVLSNQLVGIRNTLADYLIEGKTDTKATDFAIQMMHQTTQALIESRKHGEKGDATKRLIEYIHGKAPGDQFLNVGLKQKEEIRNLLEESLSPLVDISQEKEFRKISGGVFDENHMRWIADMQQTKFKEKSLDQLTEVFTRYAQEHAERKNITDEADVLFKAFMKKSGLTGRRGPKTGQFTLRQFIEEFPKQMSKIRDYLSGKSETSEFVKVMSHITGLGSIASAREEGAEAIISETEKKISKGLDMSRGLKASSDMAEGSAEAGKSFMAKMFDKSDEFLSKSPGAKWALTGTAIAGATLLTARMIGIDPTMSSPTAPPAQPMDQREYSVRNDNMQPQTPVTPVYGFSDRFVSSGMTQEPEIASLELQRNLQGSGSLDIIDQSLSEPQLQQEYDSMVRGRF